LNILPNTYQTGEFAEHDAIRNASLAAMQILLAAHSLGIDSCPMVGFKKEELRRELSIPGRYVPVVLITLGYGIKPAHETIRLPLEDLVIQESF
ncbi:nitroreductase family protein, partial [Microbacteriaceae bacterium K1510]|nr:nitroreductase family protein [Microbacteriaceae bacterium K1510]